MENNDYSSMSDEELLKVYDDVVEGGSSTLIAKGCKSGWTLVDAYCCRYCYYGNLCFSGIDYYDCYWGL